MAGSPADYSVVLSTVGLSNLERAAVELSRDLVADGAPAQASLVRQAYLQLLRDLEKIAQRTAAKAKTYIRDEERSSRVRPDTQGTGGPRLQDALGESHPLLGVEGSVGINEEPPLFANTPWWLTNEEGYSGHIGREVTGYFYDAGFTSPSRPDPTQSRVHPLFAPGKKGDGPRGGKGRRMTIRNPIPERSFVRKGAARAEAEWHADVARARARFSASVDRAIAGAAARPAGRARRP